MADYVLRAAAEQDFAAIRDLIHRVGINPMGLDWRRFLIAVDPAGRVLGCGQLKPHGKEIVELASIAVEPGYQKQGIARAIIEQLLLKAPRPLYLMCRAALEPFYQRWGFRSLTTEAMPPYFRRMARLAGLFGPLTPEGAGLRIMELM